LGFTVHRRQALLERKASGRRAIITTPPDRVAAETRAASLAYLIWPLALTERVTPRPDASQWFRFHMRQARWFGALAAVIGFAALLWPLLLSLVIANPTATIWIYGVAMLADLTLFVLWLVLAMRYSQRAEQGELFDVPWVARITGTSVRK
jgi:uncharacterized membrane protein